METHSPRRLLIVRHGATANNAEGRFTGQSSAPLSPTGSRQVEALANRLGEISVREIISSDLLRAIETAQIIAAHQTCEVTFDAALREIALGEWEGLTASEARTRDPDIFERWKADALRNAPPGGETLDQLARRVRTAWERWIERSVPGATVWVTHGGVISALLCQLLGLSLTERGRFRRDNASITEVRWQGDGAVIARVNDTAHLEALGPAGRAESHQAL